MTPFTEWSRVRVDSAHLRVANTSSGDASIEGDDNSEFLQLLDDLVQNLMAAATVPFVQVVSKRDSSERERQRLNRGQEAADNFVKIEERLVATISEVLEPVMSELHLHKLVKEFAAILRSILPEFKDQLLTIEAPQHIHSRLSHELQQQAIVSNVIETEKEQLLVIGNDVVLRADLTRWSHNIAKVAGL
jgi:hypothetical protein